MVGPTAPNGDLEVPHVYRTHVVGALPIIKTFTDRLGLARVLDDAAPQAPQAGYALGPVLVGLIANKLTSPQPLYRVREWAEEVGIETLLGVPAEAFTDDRIARLLDVVAEKVELVKTQVCLSAIEAFGLDVGRFHWDLTSLRFEGSYDEQHPLWPLITYGYDSRAIGKHKQVRVANLVAGDGAVGGLLHKTYSGNQNDVNTVTDYLQLFCTIRDRFGRQPRLVGDTKLLSPEKMVEVEQAGLWWICPEPHQPDLDRLYLSLPQDGWKPLNYLSTREARKPEGERHTFRYQEAIWSVKVQVPVEKLDDASNKGQRRRGRPLKWQDKTHIFRRLFVFSSEEQEARRTSRAHERARLEQQLEEQKVKFQSHYWRRQPESAARRAIEGILGRRTIGRSYRWELTSHAEGGWDLEYSVDQQAIEAIERLDGYYTLATNIPLREADGDSVFRDWKLQNEVERRFADWKGPLRVRPLFLHGNKRIVGLVAVLSFALLIYCLLERETRLNLRDSGEKLAGLLPVGRPVRATGRNVLQRLSTLTIVGIKVRDTVHWQLSPPTSVQRTLLTLLDTDVDLLLRRFATAPRTGQDAS